MTFKELLDYVTFKDVAKGIIRYCRDKKNRGGMKFSFISATNWRRYMFSLHSELFNQIHI